MGLEESSVLSIAEEPREIFAIGLIKARAGACGVIQGEPVTDDGLKATDESAGTGGVLEREASIATGAGDGNNRVLRQARGEEESDCLEIDVRD
jgi:hypothetical protein